MEVCVGLVGQSTGTIVMVAIVVMVTIINVAVVRAPIMAVVAEEEGEEVVVDAIISTAAIRVLASVEVEAIEDLPSMVIAMIAGVVVVVGVVAGGNKSSWALTFRPW